MEKLRTSVFILFVHPLPVSCIGGFFTEPIICYFLDGILIVYCLIATAFYFREKFSNIPPLAVNESDENCGIYQELERPIDAELYQVLEPPKRKKKAGKKKKSESAQEADRDPYESLLSTAPRPPRARQ